MRKQLCHDTYPPVVSVPSLPQEYIERLQRFHPVGHVVLLPRIPGYYPHVKECPEDGRRHLHSFRLNEGDNHE